LVWLSLVLFAILNLKSSLRTSCSSSSPRSSSITLKLIFSNCLLFVNSLLKITGIILRQGFSHDWKLLGAFELLLSIFLSVYENCITVSVVVPLVPEPLSSTKELYELGYTFVVQRASCERVLFYLSDEYNTTNAPRKVLSVNHFKNIYFVIEWTWLEKYFFNTESKEIKYAVAGHLTKHFEYQGVRIVREKNDTCYQMFPNEEAFSPEPFYFTFASALASSLQDAVSRLAAAGFTRLIETGVDFNDNMRVTSYANSLVAKHETESGHEENDVALMESLIRLGNIQLGFYAGLVVILSASFVFAVEVCTYYYIKTTHKTTVVTTVTSFD